jgi:predicted dehydrogenase
VVGGCDLRRRRAEVGERFKIPVFATYGGAAEGEAGRGDRRHAPDTHRDYVLGALAVGAHVCEKPFVSSLAKPTR